MQRNHYQDTTQAKNESTLTQDELRLFAYVKLIVINGQDVEVHRAPDGQLKVLAVKKQIITGA